MIGIRWIAAAVLAVVVGVPTASYAQQEFPNARPVWESAQSGAIAARLPGRMVRRGTARCRAAHGEMINRSRNGPTITETAPVVKPVHQLKADMWAIIFRDFNVALQLLSGQFINNGSGTLPPSNGTSPLGPSADVSDLLGIVSGPES